MHIVWYGFPEKVKYAWINITLAFISNQPGIYSFFYLYSMLWNLPCDQSFKFWNDHLEKVPANRNKTQLQIISWLQLMKLRNCIPSTAGYCGNDLCTVITVFKSTCLHQQNHSWGYSIRWFKMINVNYDSACRHYLPV